MRAVVLTFFVFVVLLSCSCDTERFYNVQKELSEFCSDIPIPKQDQRMLGHGDVLLPVFAYHFLPELRADTNHECVAMMVRDWMLSNAKMSVEEGAEDIFHFSLFHHDVDHVEWKISLVKTGVSGLPVYHVSSPSHAEEYYVKLYVFPQATDAFHADLFASYAVDRITDRTHFDTSAPILSRKCLVSDTDIFYASMSKKAEGRSVKAMITDLITTPDSKDLQSELQESIFHAARAVGEFHGKSSEIAGTRPGRLLLLSEDNVENVLQQVMGPHLPEAIVGAIAAQLEELYQKATESLSKDETVVPSNGCFSHFDLTSSNVLVDESTSKVTFLDSPLMYRSFSFAPFAIKCETESFLANPLIPMVGISHPALDYYFFSTYIGLELQSMGQEYLKTLDRSVQDGYCAGRFATDETALITCKSAKQLWTPEVETFMLQYLVSVMSPDTIARAITESVKGMPQQ